MEEDSQGCEGQAERGEAERGEADCGEADRGEAGVPPCYVLETWVAKVCSGFWMILPTMVIIQWG